MRRLAVPLFWFSTRPLNAFSQLFLLAIPVSEKITGSNDSAKRPI